MTWAAQLPLESLHPGGPEWNQLQYAHHPSPATLVQVVALIQDCAKAGNHPSTSHPELGNTNALTCPLVGV